MEKLKNYIDEEFKSQSSALQNLEKRVAKRAVAFDINELVRCKENLELITMVRDNLEEGMKTILTDDKPADPILLVELIRGQLKRANVLYQLLLKDNMNENNCNFDDVAEMVNQKNRVKFLEKTLELLFEIIEAKKF